MTLHLLTAELFPALPERYLASHRPVTVRTSETSLCVEVKNSAYLFKISRKVWGFLVIYSSSDVDVT